MALAALAGAGFVLAVSARAEPAPAAAASASAGEPAPAPQRLVAGPSVLTALDDLEDELASATPASVALDETQAASLLGGYERIAHNTQLWTIPEVQSRLRRAESRLLQLGLLRRR